MYRERCHLLICLVGVRLVGDSVYCTERGVTCQDVLKELDLWVTVCTVQREVSPVKMS